MKNLTYLLIALINWSCIQNSNTEKYQTNRDNINNVHDKIKEIKIEDVLISRSCKLQEVGDCLIIGDYKSPDKLIHIFTKNDFRYITSTAYLGQGPGEIANMGYIGSDETDHFFVSDHGKQKIFSYDLDSILMHPSYEPKVKMKINKKLFPDSYKYINDTLCIGRIIEPTGSYGYKQSIAKWNMETGEIVPMKYEHPDIEKKRTVFAVSTKDNIYVECYHYHDLITICALDGTLLYNIYGPKWNSETSNKVFYYGNVAICSNHIFISYSGETTFIKSQDGAVKSNLPTKLLIFDMNGNYIKTLETGYKIIDFCYDSQNKRVIMNFNDDIQFGYLEIDKII
ncbi:6-bladed beta-propeller [Parabacteroides chinchillae]